MAQIRRQILVPRKRSRWHSGLTTAAPAVEYLPWLRRVISIAPAAEELVLPARPWFTGLHVADGLAWSRRVYQVPSEVEAQCQRGPAWFSGLVADVGVSWLGRVATLTDEAVDRAQPTPRW